MKLLSLFNQIFVIVLLILTFTLVSDSFYKTKSYPSHVHKTLYLDRNFNDAEVLYITMAAAEWNSKTNHIVDFNVVLLPTSEEFDGDNAIIFTKVSPDYPEILSIELSSNGVILGLYQDEPIPNIEIVGGRLTDQNYKAVVLHELGHSLGLEHNKDIDGIGTLMYPYIDLGADNITEKDLKNFCALYKCNK